MSPNPASTSPFGSLVRPVALFLSRDVPTPLPPLCINRCRRHRWSSRLLEAEPNRLAYGDDVRDHFGERYVHCPPTKVIAC